MEGSVGTKSRHRLLLVGLFTLPALSGCSHSGCAANGCDYRTALHVRRATGLPFVAGTLISFRIEAASSLVEARCTVQRPIRCTQMGSGYYYLLVDAPGAVGAPFDEIYLSWEDGARPMHATLSVTTDAAAGVTTKDFPAPQDVPVSGGSCEPCGDHREVNVEIAP